MYLYTIQAMPGYKAKFDGDPSARYQIRRTLTTASPQHKSRTAVIRTDLGFEEATELAKRFNDKERESNSLKVKDDSRVWQSS